MSSMRCCKSCMPACRVLYDACMVNMDACKSCKAASRSAVVGVCVIGWYGPDRSGAPETGSVGAWLADAGTIARVGAVLACSACSGVVSSCVAETRMGSCPQNMWPGPLPPINGAHVLVDMLENADYGPSYGKYAMQCKLRTSNTKTCMRKSNMLRATKIYDR